jgi:hypothetical protein
MVAAQMAHGAESRLPPQSDDAAALWSRCEAALGGSRISLAASDREGRYTWIFNPPADFLHDAVGRLDREALPSDPAAILADAKQAVLASGNPTELELELSSERGTRWYDVRVRAHRERGQIVGTVASLVDVTDRKVQEEHLRIVLRELAHRSKNLLAVIQGIARQTAESASSTQQFVTRFNGRIFSLSPRARHSHRRGLARGPHL